MFFYSLHSLHTRKNRASASLRKIEDMQNQKLLSLLKHAYLNVPYYRNLFKKTGISPEDIENKSDLSKVPITTKSDFQSLTPKERLAKGADVDKCLNLRTSGSTGRPLDIFVTSREHLKSKTLAFLDIYLENGCTLIDKTLRVVTPIYISKNRWFQSLGILREYFVSIFEDIDLQLDKLLCAKPQAIRGFSSGIKSLALRIRDKGISITPPR